MDPAPHLSGCFVGESDGQNGPSWDSVDRDQMGDAVRNDPGFAAPGARKDQQRTFGVFDRLALAGIQTSEEVHVNTYFIMEPRLKIGPLDI
jgi:hypothetical protein